MKKFWLFVLSAAPVTFLIAVSTASEFFLTMPQKFPLKAALLLTPLGMIWNGTLKYFEQPQYVFALFRSATRPGLNFWNSLSLMTAIVLLQVSCFVVLGLAYRKRKAAPKNNNSL